MGARTLEGLMLVVVGLVAATAGVLLATHDGPAAWMPRCFFHDATGFHCPGCGGTRAVRALLGGDLLLAFRQNILLMVVGLPVAAHAYGQRWRRVLTGQPGSDWPMAIRIVLGRAAVVAFIGFFVARNVPVWPLTLLAPIGS